MQVFKNEEEYYRLAGDYFRSDSREKVRRAFAWEREQIRSCLDRRDYVKADFYLASLSAKLKSERNNYYHNPELYGFAREWLRENFDLVKQVAFAADQGAARRDSGYLFVKFARETQDFGLLTELGIFLYHTLRFYRRYLFQSSGEAGEKERNEYVVRTALIGVHRYGFEELLKPVMEDETLKEILADIPGAGRSLYPEIKKLIMIKEKDPIAYLSFIALSDFSGAFKDEIAKNLKKIKGEVARKIEIHLREGEDQNIITSEITAYLDRLASPPGTESREIGGSGP